MGFWNKNEMTETGVVEARLSNVKTETERREEKRQKGIKTLIQSTNHAIATVRKIESPDKSFGEFQTLLANRRDRLSADAMEQIGLPNQKEQLHFKIRCEQMERLGFQRFDSKEEVLAHFIGKSVKNKFARKRYGVNRLYYSWLYDHRNNKIWKLPKTVDERDGFTCSVSDITIKDEEGNTTWQWGPADFLARPIPTGALLAMAEIKELNIANQFHAIAPESEWLSKVGDQQVVPLDPIVVASVWEMQSTTSYNFRKEAHFFIAMWE